MLSDETAGRPRPAPATVSLLTQEDQAVHQVGQPLVVEGLVELRIGDARQELPRTGGEGTTGDEHQLSGEGRR